MCYVSSDFELCVVLQCNNNKLDVGNVCDAERTVRHSEYSDLESFFCFFLSLCHLFLQLLSVFLTACLSLFSTETFE